MRVIVSLASLLLLSLACGCSSSRDQAPGTLPTRAVVSGVAADGTNANVLASGTAWGGEHLRMEVAAAGVTFEFDCASGAIRGPIRPSEQGEFAETGTYSQGHGGPIREGEVPPTEPAIYSGRLSGDTITLTISFPSGRAGLGPYLLHEGDAGRVFRCL
jgi:hypothetical protein